VSNFPDYDLPGIDPDMTPAQHHAQYLELLRERAKRDADRDRAAKSRQRQLRFDEEYRMLRQPAAPGQCGIVLDCFQLGTNVVCVQPVDHQGEHASRTLEGHPTTWPRSEHDQFAPKAGEREQAARGYADNYWAGVMRELERVTGTDEETP
jgi:hypothetical protein